MKVACKIWLDHNGKAFWEGPYELLKRVKKTRCLREAACQMGMSYSKAWKLVQAMEKRLGFFLLDNSIRRSVASLEEAPKSHQRARNS